MTCWANNGDVPLVVSDGAQCPAIIAGPVKRMVEAVGVVASPAVKAVEVRVVGVSNVEGGRRDVDELLGKLRGTAGGKGETIGGVLEPPLAQVIETEPFRRTVDVLGAGVVRELLVRVGEGVCGDHRGVHFHRA